MGSKALDDQTTFEFDHLGVVSQPLQSLGLAVGIVSTHFFESVGFRSLKRGRVLAPFAANPDGIEFELGSAGVFEFFEVREECSAGGNGELRFPATSAEGIDEVILCNGLFHGLNRALITRQIPPVSRWDRTGNQRLMKCGSDIKADGH